MRRSGKLLLVGLLMLSVAFGLALPYAMAIHSRRAIALGAFPNRPIFLERPGEYNVELFLVLRPLWYYRENLNTYDTVKLNVTLTRYQTIGYGSIPIMFGDGACRALPGGGLQCTWTNVRLSQDEDGVTLDACVRVTTTFLVDARAAIGTYSLKFDAIATAPQDVTFEGHDFLAVYVVG